MFDLAILGGGPAGYTAAQQAIKHGLSVVLFEGKAIGGVCLNEGCIPTKTLLYSAKQFYNAQNAEKYGVYAENVKYNWTKILQRKTKVVRKLQAGIKAKLNSPSCVVVSHEGSICSYSNDCVVVEANSVRYEAKNLLICTGSSNVVPPIEGIDSEYVINSTSALSLQELPMSIIIIGGGVIGIEFATLYHELGVDVTVVEALPKILTNIDPDLSNYLQSKYERGGIKFFTNTKVTKIDENVVLCQSEDNEIALKADKILVCVGRKPNIDGLELLDLQYEGRGIKVDDVCRTSLPNVYAAGDVTGKMMLAHVASQQAELVVDQLIGKNSVSINYNCIPSVVYSNPEIATIGLLPTAENNLLVKQLPMTYSGRFVAENELENGLCKIVYQSDGTIVGAHIVGNYASEIIGYISFCISQKMKINDIEHVVFPHPTVSEIFKELALI